MTGHATFRGLEYAIRPLSVAFLLTAITSISGPVIGWSKAYASPTTQNQKASTEKQLTGKKPGETADHSKFKILQQDFKSGPEVTKACLSCPHRSGHSGSRLHSLEMGI